MKTAQVILNVTRFRPLTPDQETHYVDATTTLTRDAGVKLVERHGMPTLICPQAVDIELSVTSADPAESYMPLSVSFQQRGEVSPDKRDATGAINFERLPAAGGNLLFRNKRLIRGEEGRYEFFVLVQRASDGAIGLIDPEIINDPI